MATRIVFIKLTNDTLGYLKVKILIWVQRFYPDVGGIETQAMNLVRQLTACGHECLIFTQQTNDAWRSIDSWNGIKIHRFPFEGTALSFNPKTIADIVRSMKTDINAFNPDIIHISVEIHRLAFFRLFLNNIVNRLPVLVTLHGLLGYNYNRDVEHFLQTVKWVNCVSDSLLQELTKIHPNVLSKSSYIYNGIEVSQLTPAPLPYEPVRILCLSRLTAEKGLDQAIIAFYLISKKFSNVELHIAGHGSDKAKLVNLVIKLKLTSKVKFLGNVNPVNIPVLINQSTMLLIPSRYETFGFSAIEGALMARPVIATKVGGLREIFTHLETGLLVENEDIDGMVTQIEYLIQHPAQAQAIGQRGRKMVLCNFTDTKMAKKYEALYLNIIRNCLSPSLENC
jgi:glycosyltransferase involved in cell wall biosynthesis